MTVKIISRTPSEANFKKYLDAFDADFALMGFGSFSEDSSGDYAGSESSITDTPAMGDQAFRVAGELSYDITTHRLGGTMDAIAFGYGAAQDAGSGALSLAQTDFEIRFGATVADETLARAILVDLMGFDEDKDGSASSTLRDEIWGQRIEFVGKAGRDVFTGGDQADLLKGGAGADVLNGGRGADKLFGGAGADKLIGAAGADRLAGGKGADKLVGGGGPDKLFGGAGPDKLFGGAGPDKLFGGAGDDKLFGGAGDDRLAGGKGADWLSGGAGKDVLIGGAGQDRFDFTSNGYNKEIVRDFQIGQDKAVFDADDYAGFDALMQDARQVGDHVVIDTDAGWIKLVDTDLDALSASDFLFS